MTSRQTNSPSGFMQAINQPTLDEADTELLQSRRAVLRQLLALDKALSAAQWAQAEQCMPRFCASVLDYAALSTYRLADRPQLAAHTRIAIASTTRELLRFCDRYERGSGTVQNARVDLEQLALTLETRFELEDDATPVVID